MSLIKKVGSALTKQFNGFNIRVRDDGYIHATDMCKVGGKRWIKYIENKTTQEFIKELSTLVRIRTDLLIETKVTGLNENRGTWVHPYIAINLAQWVSPIFAVKVSGWVSRFISGDLSLLQESVEMLNESSGKVNNLSVATNPENGKAIVLLKTHEKDSSDARVEYALLKEKMQEMTDIHNGVIVKKDDVINSLKNLLIESEKKADEERKKADEERKKSEERFNKIMSRTEHIETKLDDTKEILTNVAREHIPRSNVKPCKYEVLIILNDPDDDYPYYVIRTQHENATRSINNIKNDYPNVTEIVNIPYPNSKKLWQKFKDKYGKYIISTTGNWFNLKRMSVDLFKKKIIRMSEERNQV